MILRKVEQFLGGGPCPSVLPTASYTGLTHEITRFKWLPTDGCFVLFPRLWIIGPWFLSSSSVYDHPSGETGRCSQGKSYFRRDLPPAYTSPHWQWQ